MGLFGGLGRATGLSGAGGMAQRGARQIVGGGRPGGAGPGGIPPEMLQKLLAGLRGRAGMGQSQAPPPQGIDQGVKGFREWQGAKLGGGGMPPQAPGGGMQGMGMAPQGMGGIQGNPIGAAMRGPRPPQPSQMGSPEMGGIASGGSSSPPGPYSDPYENMKAMRKGGSGGFGSGWGG